MPENFMTKEDFLLFESKDFLPFKADVKVQFNEIKSENRELKAEMREMKAELQMQVHQLKTELQTQIISLQRWMIGLMTGSVAFTSLLMAIFKFLH